MAASGEGGTLGSVQVEAQGGDVFRSRTLYQGQLRAVYGGQIMAQALMAASQTVDDPDMLIFSLHCYFLVPSQAHSGLLYHVERTKDGRLFVARAVRVTQGKGGKVTCYCLVSFKKQEVDPIHMPHVSSELSGGPPSSFDSVERKGIWFNKSNSSGLPYEGFFFFPNNVQKKLLDREPIEPRTYAWLKTTGSIPTDLPQNTHRALLAFLSDALMIIPILFKYPQFKLGMMTSLDHSIWFHSPVQADQRYLQVSTCLQAGEGTSLNSGRLYAEDGSLAASCQQQGLLRPKL